MPIPTSDLVTLSERLLVACDQCYAGESLKVGVDYLKRNPDPPLFDAFKPPYVSDFPGDVVAFSIDDPKTGFKCVIYQDENSRELIVAMAGTDGSDIIDWWGNVTHYGWNQWKQNRLDILNQLNVLISRLTDPNQGPPRIYFTGQSLGGALAQYAAYEFAETHQGYPNTALSLVTFNGLGGVAALRDEIPNRGPLSDIGFPGFQDEVFKPERSSAFGTIAHFSNQNDLVSRVGAAHFGSNVIAFPGRDFDHLNVATHDPYLLDTISAHKIETGYYYPLTEYVLSATDGFAEAVEAGYLSAADLSDFYLPLGSLQKVASEMGNLFHQDATSTAGGFVQLLIGGLGAMVSGDRDEVNQLVDAYIDTRYLAGRYENDEREYFIARNTDWSLRLRIGGAALGIGTVATGPFGLLFGIAGALALAPVFTLVESISSDEAEFLRTKFNAGWTGGPIPDASADEVLQRSDLLGAALDVDDPRGSDDRLATVADLARGDLENFAQAMVGDADHWYAQTSEYLVDRANETGQTSALGIAEGEFWSHSKRAAQANPTLLSSIDVQATQFVSDWRTAIADASPDAAVRAGSPLDVTRLDTYADKRQYWDGALATLENLLDLFIGTAHAEEFHAAAAQALDEARAGAQSVAIRQGRAPNPFASPDFDPDAGAALGTLAEGSVRTFTLYLPYDAGSGGQRVKLTLGGGAADGLALLDHADEVPLGADGVFTLVVPEGRKELSFSLLAKGVIGAGAALELKAQLVQRVDGVELATHNEHVELALALDGMTEALPVTSREIRGDWEAKPWTDPATGITYAYRFDDLGNVERQTDVPATQAWGPEHLLRGSSGADHMVTGDFVAQAFGDAGDDFILGSDASGNYLAGGAGSDRIEGGGWADHAAEYLELELLGRTIGLGDDKIYGGAGDDSIWGERAATQAELDDPGAVPTGLPGDWLTGGSGNDRIYGSAGDDVLLGGVGEDLLLGGAGADVLLGDDDFQIRPEGNYWQVVRPGPGSFEVGLFPVISELLSVPDDISPLTGDPYLAYYKNGGGADVLNGGAGDDILLGQAGDDTLYGGEGDDILAGWEGDDELIGGAGNDLIAGDFGRYEQVNQRTAPGTLLVSAGALGAPSSWGSAVAQTGKDLLDGGAGDDVLFGEGGDDSLIGGDGDDILYGDADYLPEELHGNDILDGGDGDDSLYGGAGEDSLYAGAGNDDLYGGAGDDLLEGGSGADILDGGDGADRLRAGDGDDELYGGGGDDELRAGAGDDALDGGEGDDVLYGESGADELNGGAGNDRLYGGIGGDTIYGGEGDDLIDGGEGSDVLRGGAGDDSYLLDFGYGRDLIEDDQGTNRLVFAFGTLPEDLAATLDSGTLTATLSYGAIGDAVSIGMDGFELGGIDFADGESWGAKQFVALLPALETQGSSGDDALEGRANLRNALHGGAGDDRLAGAGWDDLLEGGDGDDRTDGGGGSDVYYFSAAESGIDRIGESGIDTDAYLEAYYAALGIADWRTRGAHGGQYRLELEGDGRSYELYYDSQEQALAEYPGAAIEFVEALPSLAPAPRRGDDAALAALFAAGAVARDVVRFGPGVALEDLALRIAVPLASAEAHPDHPWEDGGTLSVRWGEGGFDVPVADAGYGFTGSSLPAEPDAYRLGEGIEAFELDDGSRYTLEQVLARANVLALAGEYHIGRDSGLHRIAPDYAAIVFDDNIRASEVRIARDGVDLVLSVGDGGTQGRVAGWYGAHGMVPPTAARFYFDGELDAAALSAAGLEVHGSEGDDLLLGLDGYRDALYGEGGDDVIDALGGDDYVETGAGDDIVRGGPGADDLEAWGGGGKLLEAGPGDDYVYEEGGALVIGGAGDDWIEHYGDGGVIAFNPGDGNDTVYAAGALTLSIGGGVRPGDLSLAQDGEDLVLDVGGAGSLRLTRQWEDDPAAWPEIRLQLFGSVHLYDFSAVIGTSGPLGEALDANRISVSESEGIGGAIAWQYATTGSNGALADEALRSVLAADGFGTAPQPIALAQPNRPPRLAAPIADQSALEDEPFVFALPAATFLDPDLGDALAYAATLADGAALPAWLSFDPASASFSGAPGFADGGAYALRVVATDAAGASAAGEFTLEILESEPPAQACGGEHHGQHRDGGRDRDERHEHERHDAHEHERERRGHGHLFDRLRDRLARPPQFDFSLLARELERRKPHDVLSPEEIRRSWERVARAVEKLGGGVEDLAHGAAGAADLLRLAPGGGHGFGYDASIGAARTQQGFTPFEGLREGFRRL